MRKYLAVFFLYSFASAWLAGVELPSILSDHAVLARSERCSIWGKASPGEAVSVSLGDVSARTIADGRGRWQVFLDLSSCGEGPFELKINDLVRRDILVGEVWFCSGQSNMQFQMNKELGLERETAASRAFNGRLRTFVVKPNASQTPLDDVTGTWTTEIRRFTAVGYYFGKELCETLDRPVGIVNSSWGGTKIQSWMSPESIAETSDAERLAGEQRLAAARSYPERLPRYLAELDAWEKKYRRTDPPHVLPPKDAKWTNTNELSPVGNGVVWFRRVIDIQAKEANKPFRIGFSYQKTPFSLWVDGQEVAEHSKENAVRGVWFYHTIQAGLPAGKHEFMLRMVASDDRIDMRSYYEFGSSGFPQGTPWEMYRQIDFGKPDGECLAERPEKLPPQISDRDLYGALFNAMIHPFSPMTTRGILWYQGESNARTAIYGDLFVSLIRDWRRVFRVNDELPFYFVQLPAHHSRQADANGEGSWANMRLMQQQALALPKTGMAVTTDTGETDDIHPRDKHLVGRRLALLALKNVYGRNCFARSPLATSAVREGRMVKVSFGDTGEKLTMRPIPETIVRNSSRGLTAKPLLHSPRAQIEDVALRDASGKWYWADEARLENGLLVASSKEVAEPTAIRCCHVDFPLPTLFTESGLPVAPFELPVTSATAKK